MNAPLQQPLPAPARKSNQAPMIIAIVAIFVVIALVAVFFAMPGLSGRDNNGTNYAPKNGDYIEYNVTGLAHTTTLSGTARLDVTNVTSTGFDMTITYTGIPGATTAMEHYDLSDSGFANYGYGANGVKVSTEKIQTPWGLKTVDKYFEQASTGSVTGNVTGYVGSETQLPYRIDMQGDGFFMTLLIADTNIDVIKNAT